MQQRDGSERKTFVTTTRTRRGERGEGAEKCSILAVSYRLFRFIWFVTGLRGPKRSDRFAFLPPLTSVVTRSMQPEMRVSFQGRAMHFPRSSLFPLSLSAVLSSLFFPLLSLSLPLSLLRICARAQNSHGERSGGGSPQMHLEGRKGKIHRDDSIRK